MEYGLTTRTWGLKRSPHGGRPEVGDWVLFGLNISAPNARLLAPDWVHESATLIVGEVTAPLYTGTSWHWQDEHDQARVIYPHRFGFVPVGRLERASLAADGPLGADATEALRLAVSRNRAVLAKAGMTGLLALMNVRTAVRGTGDASARLDSTLPPPESSIDDDDVTTAPGRVSDPVLRKVIENHAVARAKKHMRTLGWTRTDELGKPYDLVCTNGKDEKHVEVKGTTGAGGSVEYTWNEVQHFRNCPHGADLIVVREIEIDHSTNPPTASGGALLHVQDYRAPKEDLQPTRFNGRVTGW